MKAPLKLRQINQINSHQYRYLRCKDVKPYLCFRCEPTKGDKAMVVAEEGGLRCPLCGDVCASFPYVDKMGHTGDMLR
jgi:hypothetical protein